MRIAVLGTGRMGAGMARSLKREGLDVAVWNRTRAKADPLHDDGIFVVGTAGGAVRDADVVITMLYDTDSVLEVTEEITAAMAEGAVWLQCATVGPDGIRAIAEQAGDVALVDAPVLGTVRPAETGALVPLVSGPAEAIDKARPALDAIGSRIVVAGDRLGQASALKLACNAWVLSVTAATAQSVALAQGFGLDPHLFLEAIEGGAVDTPYAHIKGTAMIDGTLDAAFALDGGRKDLGLIRDAAGDVATDLLDALLTLYWRASETGHGEEDLAAVHAAFTSG